MNETTHSHYLRDLGQELVDLARAAAAEACKEYDAFAVGRAFGLYEIVSLMQQQALAFGLPLSDVALDGVDPDRDLLVPQAGAT